MTSANLALNKPVYVNSSIEGGEWSKNNLTDGKRTSDQTTKGYTSQVNRSPSGSEWIMVDLGNSTNINIVALYPRTTVFGHDVEGDNNDVDGCHFLRDMDIQTSDDGVDWETVKQVTGQESPGTSPRLYIFQPRQGRYIRVYVTGFGDPTPLDKNSGVHYLQFAEVEICYSPEIKTILAGIGVEPNIPVLWKVQILLYLLMYMMRIISH